MQTKWLRGLSALQVASGPVATGLRGLGASSGRAAADAGAEAAASERCFKVSDAGGGTTTALDEGGGCTATTVAAGGLEAGACVRDAVVAGEVAGDVAGAVEGTCAGTGAGACEGACAGLCSDVNF